MFIPPPICDRKVSDISLTSILVLQKDWVECHSCGVLFLTDVFESNTDELWVFVYLRDLILSCVRDVWFSVLHVYASVCLSQKRSLLGSGWNPPHLFMARPLAQVRSTHSCFERFTVATHVQHMNMLSWSGKNGEISHNGSDCKASSFIPFLNVILYIWKLLK